MIKKRLKEINVLSMSVVDLFACALGAFILIALILFPYYLKSDPIPCPQESVEKKDYILVLMSWESKDDVDMYIKDPTGAVYSYKNTEYAHSPAQFAEDNEVGPGNEIWIHPPNVTPGIYEVSYHYYTKSSGSVLVEEAKIVTQENLYSIPNCRLTREGEQRLVAKINVDRARNIQVNTYPCN